ncbi:MAG: cobalamin-dependent protein [Carboxylicivirga sp.]|jgi:5-methyltetrahydrofolate--homocysteine methyltransferase|nr:cobalamin-dependent protein [Carboxylicivirga sp.]
MKEIFEKLATCIEFGKINEAAPYPPNLKGELGADELTQEALAKGATATQILNEALIIGMEKIGIKFRDGKVFVPQVLMSAKAMDTAMQHIKPLLQQDDVEQKGTVIIGTVEGDLHDIGKNIVAMMVEGNGWNVVDLGTNVNAGAFKKAVEENPGSHVALSALLTTTMANMENITKELKEQNPETQVLIGGAPVDDTFCEKIGADCYSPDPQGTIDYLNKCIA